MDKSDKNTKHAGGRPTDYSDKKLGIAKKYLKDCIDTFDIPYIEQLAIFLDVNDETILEWEKRYDEFSATIKKLRSVQKFMLMKGSIESKYNPASAIFQLKVNHGMIETSKQDITSNGKELNPVLVKFLDENNRDTK